MSLAQRLNKRVTLHRQSTNQDEVGQPVISWAEVATVWAEVKDMSGREYVAAGAMQNSAQTKITIRYRPGILASMRVVCGGDMYNIESVLGQDNRTLLLMCNRLA